MLLQGVLLFWSYGMEHVEVFYPQEHSEMVMEVA